MVDRTRIERFQRAEAWGAGAQVIFQTWDDLPYRLRAAIVETLEGEHTRHGVVRYHLQITEGFRMHVVSSGKRKGYVDFKQQEFSETGKMVWKNVTATRAQKILTTSRVKSIWGSKSGYSHIGRKRGD